jgi:hypothetical protein
VCGSERLAAAAAQPPAACVQIYLFKMGGCPHSRPKQLPFMVENFVLSNKGINIFLLL